MTITVPLVEDSYYHIYNRGNNKEIIFKSPEDYLYFLSLAWKHISPVAEIYAYCLLGNHFHFLIKVRPYEHATLGRPKRAEQAFSNLFNSYAKYFNLRYNRSGKLFAERFKRKEVTEDFYLIRLVYYIHTNPQKHKLCKDFRDYPYSSYRTIVLSIPSDVQTATVLEWFGNANVFKNFHDQEMQLLIERLTVVF